MSSSQEMSRCGGTGTPCRASSAIISRTCTESTCDMRNRTCVSSKGEEGIRRELEEEADDDEEEKELGE